MKLRFIIISDNAFADETGRLTIIQAFDNISASGFPAIHPRISIVTRWDLNSEEEKMMTHKQTIAIYEKSTGNEIAKTPERTLKANPGHDSSIQFINNIIGIKFDRAGVYQVKVQMDDEIEDVNLEVKQAPN